MKFRILPQAARSLGMSGRYMEAADLYEEVGRDHQRYFSQRCSLGVDLDGPFPGLSGHSIFYTRPLASHSLSVTDEMLHHPGRPFFVNAASNLDTMFLVLILLLPFLRETIFVAVLHV